MTTVRARIFQAPGRRWILALLLLIFIWTFGVTFFMDLKMFAWRTASLIHHAFLLIYVDAGSFVSGCF